MKKLSAANGKTKTAVKPKKAANAGHKLAKTFPTGTVLTDLTKSEWKLGNPIGSGGFGLLYLAARNSSSPVADSARFVIKVEPHSNGPLFCELHFYQRAAKQDNIREWMSTHRLKSLGVPKFIATGNIDYDGIKYRFLVMERFGTDLQKLFESAGRRFSIDTVFLLGIKLLDALEYIHNQDYVHADIKASNLLTGYDDEENVYLVDYGLAFRFAVDGKHKEYKEDPKRAHDGTIEFTSRDAHRGVAPSRRGDLEILGFCMVQWLCGRLPWEDKLSDKSYVKEEKNKYMSDISVFMKKCFPSSSNIPVKELTSYLEYIAHMKYDETPDYKRCRAIFNQVLAAHGCKETDKLNFQTPSTSVSTPKGNRKRVYPESPCPKLKSTKSPSATPVFNGRKSSPKVKQTAAMRSQPSSGKKATPVKKAIAPSPGKKATPVKKAIAPSPAKKATPVKKAIAPTKPVVKSESSLVTPSTASTQSTSIRVKRRRVGSVNSTATQTTPSLSRPTSH